MRGMKTASNQEPRGAACRRCIQEEGPPDPAAARCAAQGLCASCWLPTVETKTNEDVVVVVVKLKCSASPVLRREKEAVVRGGKLSLGSAA